jgi:cation transport regulator
MPYESISDLPEAVRNNLPKGAQEIYRAAFNSAYKEYADPEKRRGDDREATAHQVAWAAVKRKYAKGGDDKWHASRSEGSKASHSRESSGSRRTSHQHAGSGA